MNRNRLIAVILAMCLIAGCQIFTPTPEPATRVETVNAFPSAGSVIAVDSFVLVSDLDDTVKITNVPDKKEMFKNALASELVFAGMPELYRYLLGENSPERLRFLSGSLFILEYNVCELLNHAHFPAYKLTLRGWKELRSSPFGFKMEYMEELYGTSKDKFLLVGDDTECDPEVYEAFSASLKPNQVLAIYIHKITGEKGKKLPAGSVFFVTAYDIAMHEFLAGRLTEKQASNVGDAVLKSEELTFLPGFQHCPSPKEYEQIAGLPKNLVQLKKQIEGRMTTLCSKRTNMNTSSVSSAEQCR